MGKRKAREAKLNDLYEAEESDPDEEKKAGQRYDEVDNYEFQLPENFEDEEIDEEMAFTEEDQKLYAGMLGSSKQKSRQAANEGEEALLDSAEEDEDEPELDRDDFSEEDEEADARFGKPSRRSTRDADPSESDVDDIFVDVSDVESDEDAESGGDPDASELQTVAKAVREAVGRPQRRAKAAEPVDEAMPESEFNLPLGASGPGELSIEDLVSGLGPDKSRLASARKHLDRLTRRAEVVAPPLPGPIRERKERQAGYEKTSEDVSKWTPIVKANREAPTLQFTSNANDVHKTSTVAALTAKFEVGEGMEAEVAALLRQAGVHSDQAVQEAEEALALKAVNAEEMQQRREALAKMRSLLFKHEEKSRHLAKIKSKAYHRRSNKAARLKAEKAGELGDGDFIRLQAEEAEFKRAKERLTLKHKNTSQWARRALKRGVNIHEDGKKEAIAEQLRLGHELRRKVERSDPVEGSDTEASDDGSSTGSEDDGSGDDVTGDATETGGLRLGRSATAKAKAAALDILQGGGDGAGDGDDASKGLFALPFMRRAQEKRKLAAQEDARRLLAELDGPADSEDAEPSQRGRRMFGQPGTVPAVEAGEGSDEDIGSSDEDEGREERRKRLRSAAIRDRAQSGATAGTSTALPVHGMTRVPKSGKMNKSSRKLRPGAAARNGGSNDESAAQQDSEWGTSHIAMSDGPLSIDADMDLRGPQPDGRSHSQDDKANEEPGNNAQQPGGFMRQSGGVLDRVARQQGTVQGRAHLFSGGTPPQGAAAGHKTLNFNGAAAGPGTPNPRGTAAVPRDGASKVLGSSGEKKERGHQVPKVSIGPQAAADAEAAAETAGPAQQFQAAKIFQGVRAGFWFGKGPQGLGYYREGGAGFGKGGPITRKAAAAHEGKSRKGKKTERIEEADADIAEAETGEEQDDVEEGVALQLGKGGEPSQRELIARAFAGDDVAAEFAEDKAAEVLEELPKIDAPSLLPGWGAWAHQQREPKWMAASKAKAERQKAAAAAGRKDAKLKAVTISERWDKKSAKFNSATLPYPHNSKEGFERSMRQPLGPDFNTTTSFRDMTRPAVIKSAGMVIQPIKYSKPVAQERAKLPSNNAKRKKIAKVGAGMPLHSKH